VDIKKLRKKLENGGVVIGTCVVECRNRQIGRIFSNSGFDFIIFDCEHGSYDLETIADMVTISKLSGIVPFIKIGQYDYATFSRYLDAGADGFILPRIREAREVEQVMEWIRFHPDGKRGYSPASPYCNYGYDIEDKDDHRKFLEQKNREVFIVVQFETKEAVKNVDSILSVNGIDSVVMGPCDLSMSLGIPGDMSNPEMKKASTRVFDACRRHNICIGNTAVDMDSLKQQIKSGLQFIWWKTDLIYLQASAEEVSRIKDILQDNNKYFITGRKDVLK